nr:MAG: replication initiator protein [Microvirus sp.]
MPCYHPVTAWRSRHVNPSGKVGLVFQEDKAAPFSELQIPCGGCIGCRLDKSRQWMLRLMHEAKYHEQKSFLTLTYDDLQLPENGSLDKTHFQKFMKRLRKQHGGKLRYFMCGEYGDQTQRPHYHAILYGCDFSDRRPHSKGAKGDQIYISETLDRIWTHGNCYIGNVTPESCGYVARYIMKKVTGEQANDHYGRINPATGEWYLLQPEYLAMSLKPGIGATYYDEFKTDLYPSDFAISKGRELPVPKYYDRQLEKENPDLLETLKARRKARAIKNKADNTPERLAVRKTIIQSKSKMLTRTL